MPAIKTLIPTHASSILTSLPALNQQLLATHVIKALVPAMITAVSRLLPITATTTPTLKLALVPITGTTYGQTSKGSRLIYKGIVLWSTV